jgi:hypothetical protein
VYVIFSPKVCGFVEPEPGCSQQGANLAATADSFQQTGWGCHTREPTVAIKKPCQNGKEVREINVAKISAAF